MTRDYVTSAEIGGIIRNRRKELGYSQEQLAERIGVSYQQIQRYENGNSMLNVENIQRIAKALGVTVEECFACRELQRQEVGSGLSDEERSLLRSFRDLTVADRRMATSVVKRLAKRL